MDNWIIELSKSFIWLLLLHGFWIYLRFSTILIQFLVNFGFLSRFAIFLVLELYLSSIPAYFCGISGVYVIFVVLNNAGSKKKKGRIPDPGSAIAS